MMEMKNGAGVYDRHETVPNKFQHVHTREFCKRSIVQWLFGKNCCTDNGGECLDLFLFEIME